MTKKNNNDNNTPDQEKKSAEEVSKATNASDTTETKAEQPAVEQASQPEAKSAATKQPEFEEKQGKRGVKLGTIAIVISLLIGGGLTFQMQQKNAQYQAQIDALQAQLKQL